MVKINVWVHLSFDMFLHGCVSPAPGRGPAEHPGAGKEMCVWVDLFQLVERQHRQHLAVYFAPIQARAAAHPGSERMWHVCQVLLVC